MPRPLTSLAASVGDDLLFPSLAEFLRKAALGVTTLLVVTRAYYPSEDAETGSGLTWILCLIGVTGLAIAANLLNGTTRFRWSWADPLVILLVLLVAWSAGHAVDRRYSINMAWEWGGLGLLYFLTRNLPRSRGESTGLACVVVVTGVAVAVYGLYQTTFEFPKLRSMFLVDPVAMMGRLAITPGTPTAELFKNRLMDSNEPFATFALANSLAGFLIGPFVILLAVGLERLKRTERGMHWLDLILAAGPALALLGCLLLTKSRSAWVGVGVACLVLGWCYRAAISRRWMLGTALACLLALTGLITVGVVAGRLDFQVLTEARKSLGYRWEYWVGAWGVITDAPAPFATTFAADDLLGGSEVVSPRSSRPFWWGVGPANFTGPYLRHKLPEASEEIKDPHNLILEVWSESGVFAMMMLVLCLGVGLNLILRPSPPTDQLDEEFASGNKIASPDKFGWLIMVGSLGWFGVWILGQLDPVSQGDMLARWLILGTAWLLGASLILPICSRGAIPAVGLGAAVAGITVNLLAAGGIGIPSVAMLLWLILALGQNVREDRPCGRLRTAIGIGPGIALACGWSVIAGTFFGAVVPGWRSELALAQGEAAMTAQPPRLDRARTAFAEAIEFDRYSVRPWIALANLEYLSWRFPETGEKNKTSWTKVTLALDKALEGQFRNPDNLDLRRLQAKYARLILRNLPGDAKPFEIVGLRGTIAKATRHAVRLYPTSAPLRGELALASADLGRYADAVGEAKLALRLDDLTPHADKKLASTTRGHLLSQIPLWDQQARVPAPTPLAR